MSSFANPARARERMSNVVDLFTDQLAGAAKTTERYVRSKPWQAVAAITLASLAAGAVVTRNVRRARRRRADTAAAASEVSGG